MCLPHAKACYRSSIFSFKYVISSAVRSPALILHLNWLLDYQLLFKLLFATGGYRWMITPEMIQQIPGVLYIDIRLFNSSWEPGLTLTITSFMSKCLYWHIERQTWSGEGCRVSFSAWTCAIFFSNNAIICLNPALLFLSQVGELSTPQRTQCLCNHLTLFGSSFFVMPNYVDVTRTAELFATVSENYVVLALLCAFFGLYLVTVLWACYADRRSRSKVSRC